MLKELISVRKSGWILSVFLFLALTISGCEEEQQEPELFALGAYRLVTTDPGHYEQWSFLKNGIVVVSSNDAYNSLVGCNHVFSYKFEKNELRLIKIYANSCGIYNSSFKIKSKNYFTFKIEDQRGQTHKFIKV